MKNILHFTTAVLFILLSFQGKTNPINDTVAMGPVYANDVFYSLANGVVKTEVRNNWDIAFYTNRWSAGIVTNYGTGVTLYTYPFGDTTAWNTMDTTGMAEWQQMYNSDTIWEEGAFNRNASEHPDYGWGVYNMISHDVVGDSLFILKLADGSLKKVWIQRKNSVNNTFTFKYANINGTDEVSEILDVTPYQNSRMFIYYSLTNQAVVDREPDIDTWDLMWSRYNAIVYDNSGNPSYYVVVGVTNNLEVAASKHHPVSPDFENWYSSPLEEYKTPIGHEWKSFNMAEFAWVIPDSLVYFVKSRQGDIYKLTFDYFSGSGAGKTGIVKKLISLVSVDETTGKDSDLLIFPNPAVNEVFVALSQSNSPIEIRIYDQSGRMVFNEKVVSSIQQHRIAVNQLQNGIYTIESISDGKPMRQKLLIQH
ncbi:MAG: hypothetical protein CVT92_08425 [Bacteroidetes bacterium HGW-Bacteroidetes-1]|jgi:hypothetical protein|nr:MAG: hypothetical protein CVT92_08425 [Bacteroidetes bacterium HGW-Bacteroidetes-1]